MKQSDASPARSPQIYETSAAVPTPHFNRRGAEKKLIALMTLGNPGLLRFHMEDTLAKAHAKDIAQLSAVSPAQAKYMGIALVSMACRAATEEGVPPQTAEAISNVCMQNYDAMEDPGRQWEVAQKVLRRFCEAISTVKLDAYSSAVRQCCEYIHQKIHSNVSLEELSEVCHLSPHYVSDLFRKETGMGALQYAHQAKMQYAKYLLENSDRSIAEIAALLSYPSHSNFSQRFKKTYGVTPHEFRSLFGK